MLSRATRPVSHRVGPSVRPAVRHTLLFLHYWALLPLPKAILPLPKALLPLPKAILPLPKALLPLPSAILPLPKAILPLSVLLPVHRPQVIFRTTNIAVFGDGASWKVKINIISDVKVVAFRIFRDTSFSRCCFGLASRVVAHLKQYPTSLGVAYDPIIDRISFLI